MDSLNAAGRFMVEVLNADGEVKVAHEFTNLWLDTGIDGLATSDFEDMTRGCKLGSSAAEPAVTDTALPGFVVGVWRESGYSGVGGTGTQTHMYYTSVYLSGIGGATGTFTNIGIGDGVSSYVRAWSKIKDINGTPISLTVLNTEQLRVTYTVRVYVEGTGVSTGTVAITDGTTTTNYPFSAYRRGFATGGINWDYPHTLSGATVGGYSGSGTYALTPPSSPNGWESIVSAVNAGEVNTTQAAYTAGTFYRDATISCDINTWNFTGGIRHIYLRAVSNPGHNNWVIHFPTPIPKDNTKTFSMTFRCYYGRYTGAIS